MSVCVGAHSVGIGPRHGTPSHRLRAIAEESGWFVDLIPQKRDKPIRSLRGVAEPFVCQLKSAVGEQQKALHPNVAAGFPSHLLREA
jgi:hypothetical protein